MMGPGTAPLLVLSQNTKRDSGKKVQKENIQAAKVDADVIRSCLGPQVMLKMLMDPTGKIVMTNDENVILREITVQHSAGKSMIEITRTQDEEVGDGTTSVTVLAGESLARADAFLERRMRPTIIIRAYREALENMFEILQDKISVEFDCNDRNKLVEVVKSCAGTKFIECWSDLACKIAFEAVRKNLLEEYVRRELDIKER
ncbi:T-complex protein 1 subunit gamma-like [Microplitis mediator]|uniref:T-complex protein 1 subunit gamma-like n=1 Tax=Microplitis mediator TaxID=375433 RepID=UPI002552CA05|nr:T-complex protein 1 subunit gamma-like [Microplitis mediator]